MKINGIKILATNPHDFDFKPHWGRYVNKTCDEIIWESLSNQRHRIYHDRSRYNGTSIQHNDVEGIKIICEILK